MRDWGRFTPADLADATAVVLIQGGQETVVAAASFRDEKQRARLDLLERRQSKVFRMPRLPKGFRVWTPPALRPIL